MRTLTAAKSPESAGRSARKSATALRVAPGAPDKDESGHGRKGAHEYKEACRDGNCKVERQWAKNGNDEAERRCEGRDRHHGRPVVVEPAPVVVYPRRIVVEQGMPE